jgi:hypothetical protein
MHRTTVEAAATALSAAAGPPAPLVAAAEANALVYAVAPYVGRGTPRVCTCLGPKNGMGAPWLPTPAACRAADDQLGVPHLSAGPLRSASMTAWSARRSVPTSRSSDAGGSAEGCPAIQTPGCIVSCAEYKALGASTNCSDTRSLSTVRRNRHRLRVRYSTASCPASVGSGTTNRAPGSSSRRRSSASCGASCTAGATEGVLDPAGSDATASTAAIARAASLSLRPAPLPPPPAPAEASGVLATAPVAVPTAVRVSVDVPDRCAAATISAEAA